VVESDRETKGREGSSRRHKNVGRGDKELYRGIGREEGNSGSFLICC